MAFKALRFDERTARFDRATKTIQGPSDVLMKSSSQVAVICDAPWEFASKHSFFVVRESRRAGGIITHKDIVLFPPGRFPHEYGPMADLNGKRIELDDERLAFLRRLMINASDRQDSKSVTGDKSARRPALDQVMSSVGDRAELGAAVSAAISEFVAYSGRLEMHLFDVHVEGNTHLVDRVYLDIPFRSGTQMFETFPEAHSVWHKVAWKVSDAIAGATKYNGTVLLVFLDENCDDPRCTHGPSDFAMEVFVSQIPLPRNVPGGSPLLMGGMIPQHRHGPNDQCAGDGHRSVLDQLSTN